jgi:hypothetical protein
MLKLAEPVSKNAFFYALIDLSYSVGSSRPFDMPPTRDAAEETLLHVGLGSDLLLSPSLLCTAPARGPLMWLLLKSVLPASYALSSTWTFHTC